MSGLLWWLPDEALPLVIALVGLALMLGLIRIRTALTALLTVLLLVALTPLLDAFLAMLPGWLLLVLVLLAGLSLLRGVLELTLGRQAAAGALGNLAADAIRWSLRLLFGLFILPFRALGWLLQWLTRGFILRALVVVLCFGMVPHEMQANRLGRAVHRAATRRLTRTQILRIDAMRHRAAAVKPLPQARTVHRYTTLTRAQQELRHGIPPNAHMTAAARRGRPMSAQAAKERYGLLRKPTVRETIQLPKGFPVRHAHATNAARGVRELTSPKRVPPEAIKKVTPLAK